MMNPLFFLFILFLSPCYSLASLELKVSGGLRTEPSGAALNFDTSYKISLWGEGDFQGYLRPLGRLGVTGVMEGAIEFYPLSFFGIRVGSGMTERYYDIPSLPCDELICRGRIFRDYYTLYFMFGFKDWFMTSSYGEERLSLNNYSKPMGVETGPLMGAFGRDILSYYNIKVGYNISESFRALVSFGASWMKNTKTDLNYSYGIFQWMLDPWTLFGGAGVFKSTHFNESVSWIVGGEWKIL